MTLRDLNFFYDSPINDLSAGQLTRAILRRNWSEAEIEIYEHDLMEKRHAKNRNNNKHTV